MKEKCKVILGQKRPGEFSREERELIVKEYLNSDCTKRWIWEKYTGKKEEKGNLLVWIRQLGYEELYLSGKRKRVSMPKKEIDESFENLPSEQKFFPPSPSL